MLSYRTYTINRGMMESWRTLFNEDLVQAYEGTAREILGFLDVPIPHDLALGKRKLLSQADSLTETWIEEYLERKRTGWEDSTARYPRGR